jgi:hypothetical protein
MVLPAPVFNQGNCFRDMGGEAVGGASHHVRLECGTWKPLFTVRADVGSR